MQRLLTRITPIIFSSVFALAGTAACGGDDDGDDGADGTDDGDDGGDDDDGGDAPDAGAPDAAPPVTRSGTLAVTETTISNDLGKIPVAGAAVAMSYIDDQTVTVAPVPGFTTSTGGCLITTYNRPADVEPTVVGEGSVTVGGTAHGEFACAFVAGQPEYVCQSTNPAIAGGVAGNAATGTLDADTDVFLLEGGGFTPEMQGMSIRLSGFGDADGDYPIVAAPAANQLQLFGIDVNGIEGGKDATFTTFVGASPIPNAAGFNFLDAGKKPVTIAKTASDLVPAIDVSINARGEGLELVGTQPHEFPTAPADLTFSCDGAGCGAEPANTGLIPAMIINGVTTDAKVNPADPTDMPLAEGSYATFTCSALSMDTITIPEAGIEAILGTNPTRVQVTVGRVAASLVPVPDQAETRVVVGHSLTGFTDIAPPKGVARPKRK